MTPMVDITFLLLIFFMVTAAFLLQKSMPVPPMDDDQQSASQTIADADADAVNVRIDGDNVYWVSGAPWPKEQRAASEQEMRVKIREARQALGTAPARLVVQASGDAIHGKVVAALDAAMAAEMEDIQLVEYDEDEL